MKVIGPLIVPIVAVVVALPAGVLFFRSYVGVRSWRNVLLWTTVLAAVTAAMVPNSAQRMYDFGVPLRVSDLLEAGSYFVFVFALTGAWMLSGRGWFRLALLLLVPVALFDPLRWTWALTVWSIWGFAP